MLPGSRPATRPDSEIDSPQRHNVTGGRAKSREQRAKLKDVLRSLLFDVCSRLVFVVPSCFYSGFRDRAFAPLPSLACPSTRLRIVPLIPNVFAFCASEAILLVRRYCEPQAILRFSHSSLIVHRFLSLSCRARSGSEIGVSPPTIVRFQPPCSEMRHDCRETQQTGSVPLYGRERSWLPNTLNISLLYS